MVNKPADQSSRWSSGSNNQMQFITLQLEKPSIVRKFSYIRAYVCLILFKDTITFGKYHKGLLFGNCVYNLIVNLLLL
jgi:hypothetical protein